MFLTTRTINISQVQVLRIVTIFNFRYLIKCFQASQLFAKIVWRNQLQNLQFKNSLKNLLQLHSAIDLMQRMKIHIARFIYFRHWQTAFLLIALMNIYTRFSSSSVKQGPWSVQTWHEFNPDRHPQMPSLIARITIQMSDSTWQGSTFAFFISRSLVPIKDLVYLRSGECCTFARETTKAMQINRI